MLFYMLVSEFFGASSEVMLQIKCIRCVGCQLEYVWSMHKQLDLPVAIVAAHRSERHVFHRRGVYPTGILWEAWQFGRLLEWI